MKEDFANLVLFHRGDDRCYFPCVVTEVVGLGAWCDFVTEDEYRHQLEEQASLPDEVHEEADRRQLEPQPAVCGGRIPMKLRQRSATSGVGSPSGWWSSRR